MLIGDLRVSTADQNMDLQRDALIAAGVAERDIYLDKASGKLDDRPGLDACLEALRSGDSLIVWKLDRLGRSLRHLVTTVQEISARGVGFCSPGTAPTSTRARRRASWCSASSRRWPSSSAS